jgi:hypothetical protein
VLVTVAGGVLVAAVVGGLAGVVAVAAARFRPRDWFLESVLPC